MIELSNVTFFYERERPIFRNFSLLISKGESLAVLGPSGCGKTTFLYLVAGLLKPQEGEIKIEGEQLKGPREKTALILQDYGLLPWKTIRENVELGLKFRKILSDSLPDQWLKKMGIYDVRNRYPHQVSGGQKQRAAIARSLILDPDLVLMDEPFSSLDAPTRECLQDLIVDLHSESNITVILVTHTIEEAAYVGERILLLLEPPHEVPLIIENRGRPKNRKDKNFLSICSELRSKIEVLWERKG